MAIGQDESMLSDIQSAWFLKYLHQEAERYQTLFINYFAQEKTITKISVYCII